MFSLFFFVIVEATESKSHSDGSVPQLLKIAIPCNVVTLNRTVEYCTNFYNTRD